MRLAALLVCLGIALALPMARLYSGGRLQRQALDIELDQLARELSRKGDAQAKAWRPDPDAVAAVLQRDVHRKLVDAIVVVDLQQREIAHAGEWVAGRWFEGQASVLDGGVAIATVRIQSSAASLVWATAQFALLGLALAAALWWFFVRLALSTVSRSFRDMRRAFDRAEQAGRARSSFLAMMSHEIRTPMNGVLGMASLLLTTQLDKTQWHYVDVIRSSGDALLRVINDILEFSKVESGAIMLETQVFQPDAVVEDVLTLMSMARHDKAVELLCRPSPGLPAWVSADAGRLRQVLLNVVGNALKFTEQGEVLVSVESPAPGRLRYSVSDTGIGMTRQQMHALFTPFSQADASTTRRFGGTGLGLAISRRLVALMGGHIDCSSTPGKGSTFVLEIDAPATEPPMDSVPAPRLDTLLGQRLLLVDDNNTNLAILNALATGWGMHVTAFNDPFTALSSFGDSSAFDIAILDYNMPGMNGADLAQRLRVLRADLPLLLLSSSDGAEAASVHFDARLDKPLRRAQLLDALLMLLAPGPATHAAPAVTPQNRPGALALAHPDAAATRILVVEDNAVNALIVRTMLERLGYLSEHAEDGAEALSAVARQDFDLIFMDMQMPGMDGLQATRRIRALASDKAPYIVAFTANVMAEARAACTAAGMNAFIAKPMRLSDLEHCLAEYKLAARV